MFAITCDHVIKTLTVPDGGPWDVYPPLTEGGEPIGSYEGLSLASESVSVADLAAVRLRDEIEIAAGRLPAALPGSRRVRVRGVTNVRPGAPVLLWNSAEESYQSGLVARVKTAAMWPHGKYGPRRFEQQFAVSIEPSYVPSLGDSGGPVLTREGELVGFLAALSCVVTGAGQCIAHCVPALPSLRLLGVAVVFE